MRALPADIEADFVLDVLLREGSLWVRTATASMAPLIQPGDDLRLVPIAPGRVRPGMVVGFRAAGRLVVHRVVRRRRGGCVTRGDGLPGADPPVAAADLVGRVVEVRTPAGRLIPLTTPEAVRVDRLLALVSRLPAPGRLGWIARRLPFHLVARLRR